MDNVHAEPPRKQSTHCSQQLQNYDEPDATMRHTPSTNIYSSLQTPGPNNTTKNTQTRIQIPPNPTPPNVGQNQSEPTTNNPHLQTNQHAKMEPSTSPLSGSKVPFTSAVFP